jgi:hypothetical protein
MDWIPGVVVALIGVAGVLFSQWMSLRDAAAVRKEERRIQASRRWDDQRLSAYAEVIASTMILIEIIGKVAPFWERGDGDAAAPLLQQFEDQRDTVSRAHAHAAMLASRPVRNSLRRLWVRTVEAGLSLDQASDGTEAGDHMAARQSQEIGDLMGEFRLAAATEFGIDDAVDS